MFFSKSIDSYCPKLGLLGSNDLFAQEHTHRGDVDCCHGGRCPSQYLAQFGAIGRNIFSNLLPSNLTKIIEMCHILMFS